MSSQVVQVDWTAIIKVMQGQIKQLQDENKELAKERDLYKSLVENKKPKISEEDRLREQQARQKRLLTGLKSDGKAISTPADSVRSYDELKTILDFLKHNGRLGVRNWAIFQVGVCMGLRVSDLVKIKWNWVLNEDLTFKERIPIVEQKTSKTNNCFISEGVRVALTEYRKWLGKSFDINGYIFAKTNGEMIESKSVSRIFKEAGNALHLPIHLTSHSMRKSFSTIVLCVYDGGMNDTSMRELQGMLGHADVRTTMRYLNETQLRYDEARKAVSDFVMGKTDVNKLVAPKQCSNNDIYNLILECRED